MCVKGIEMTSKILIVFLITGAVLGFAAGFRSLGHHGHWHRGEFERHVADVCVAAAHRVIAPEKPAAK
jgi:hypothetical protein